MEELDKETKKRLLNIIRQAAEYHYDNFSQGDVVMLFHWVRYKDDPIYSFVPEKYRKF